MPSNMKKLLTSIFKSGKELKFKSIKGTKDILPDEVHLWQNAESKIRTVMELFNYREIRTPIFEETSLFTRGIGELTDIVGKEMYTFVDRGGDSLTLKPEVTASVIRAFIQHNLGEQQPLTKVYYISPAFRQERPQAGRLRQFHQFGAEAIGSSDPAVDAEIISLSSAVYQSFGIKEFDIRINSVGCQNCRAAYKQTLKSFLSGVAEKLSPDSQRRLDTNPMRILDSKNEDDKNLTRNAPLIVDHLCEECRTHFQKLKNILDGTGIKYVVDGRIVRGLDYYTKTAYEILSRGLGSQDALAGGGRYDLLVNELGGKPTPSVGFAAGMERLLMVLAQTGNFKTEATRIKLYTASADENSRKHVFHLVMQLRNSGISCDLDLLNRSLKAQMREADRQKAQFVVIIGENELKSNSLTVKNMKTGVQEVVATKDLADYLNKN
jgi:histidyl-tRNA synthetase